MGQGHNRRNNHVMFMFTFWQKTNPGKLDQQERTFFLILVTTNKLKTHLNGFVI